MTRLDALKALAEKVEAGDFWSFVSWRALDYQFFDLGGKAFDGSLDAAKALHEAVLPGAGYLIGNLSACVTHDDRRLGGYAVKSDDPARAWLLAILRALIAQEESK